MGKRQARRVVWARVLAFLESEGPADWADGEESVLRTPDGQVSENTLLTLEEAVEDVAALIRRKHVEAPPERPRGRSLPRPRTHP